MTFSVLVKSLREMPIFFFGWLLFWEESPSLDLLALPPAPACSVSSRSTNFEAPSSRLPLSLLDSLRFCIASNFFYFIFLFERKVETRTKMISRIVKKMNRKFRNPNCVAYSFS